jgi:hypothetical protein
MYCYEDLHFNEEKKISVVNKKNPLIFYKNIKLDNSYNYKKYFINKYNYKIKIKQLNENIKKQWFVDFIWFLSMMEEIIWLNDGLNERMSNQKWVRKPEMSYIMKWRVMEVATWREEERKGMNTRIFHNLFGFLYRIIEFYSKLCWKHIHYGFILNMVYSNHEYIHY